ncbi:MAG: ABC transporter substrate-binding protein [Ignavibacteria bacterium]
MKNIINIIVLVLVISISGFAQKTVNVPLDAFTAVAAQKGWLKEEFAKIGRDFKIVDFANVKLAGAEAALLERGDLHFASRMSYPAYMHKLNGLDAVVIWTAQPADTTAVSVIVLKDSPYRKVTDLKGKTVGTVRYHCGYAGALEIFERSGIPLKTEINPNGSVTWWNSPGYLQLQQGLLTGKLDAVVDHLSIAVYAAPYLQGQFRVLSNLPGCSGGNVGVYHKFASRIFLFSLRSWAEKNPDAIKAYLTAREKARKYIISHPDEAATTIAKDLRVPLQVAKFQINSPYAISYAPGESSWSTVVNALVEFQKQYGGLNDPLVSKKSLSKSQIENYVDRRFYKGGPYSLYQ